MNAKDIREDTQEKRNGKKKKGKSGSRNRKTPPLPTRSIVVQASQTTSLTHENMSKATQLELHLKMVSLNLVIQLAEENKSSGTHETASFQEGNGMKSGRSFHGSCTHALLLLLRTVSAAFPFPQGIP